LSSPADREAAIVAVAVCVTTAALHSKKLPMIYNLLYKKTIP